MSLRASALYVAGRAAAGAMSLLAVSLFARGLGPEAYAWYALAATVATFAVAIFLQPIQHALARFHARDAAVAPRLRRILWALILALLALALLCEALRIPAVPRGLLIAAWGLGAAQALFDFATQHASSSLQPGRYAVLYLVKALGLVLIGSALLPWGAPAVVLAVCLAIGVALGVAGRGAFARQVTSGIAAGIAANADFHKQLRAFCLPLSATLLVGAVLQWADRFVLAHAVSPADLGAFAAVGDLSFQSLGFLFGALYLAWYPRMVQAHEADDAVERTRLAQRYALLALAVLLPATLGFVLLRESLVSVFFGAQYSAVGTAILPWLAIAIALAGMRMYFFDVGLYLASRMGIQLRNVGIAAGFSVLLNIWLVPRHGVMAAGWVAVIAQVVALCLSWWSARGVLCWALPWAHAWPVLASSAVMALAVLGVQSVLIEHGLLSLLVQMSAGVLVFAVAMLATDGLACRDWLRSLRA